MNSNSISIITCSKCGTKNKVTITMSDFGPANQERDHGHCVNCGTEIINKKCLSLTVEAADEK